MFWSILLYSNTSRVNLSLINKDGCHFLQDIFCSALFTLYTFIHWTDHWTPSTVLPRWRRSGSSGPPCCKRRSTGRSSSSVTGPGPGGSPRGLCSTSRWRPHWSCCSLPLSRTLLVSMSMKSITLILFIALFKGNSNNIKVYWKATFISCIRFLQSPPLPTPNLPQPHPLKKIKLHLPWTFYFSPGGRSDSPLHSLC